MKRHHPLIILTLLIVTTAGCAQKPNQIKIPRDAAPMEVEFSWETVKPCTHESPEIRVAGIPDGSLELRVRLKNINVPEWNQGGGRVKLDGSGVIPAGALQIGYNGPCPPAGKRHKYEFWVMAVDAEGQIIGFGKARQPFPPKR